MIDVSHPEVQAAAIAAASTYAKIIFVDKPSKWAGFVAGLAGELLAELSKDTAAPGARAGNNAPT